MSHAEDIKTVLEAASRQDDAPPIDAAVRVIAGALDDLYHIRVALQTIAEVMTKRGNDNGG
jgi:hypothetical protein